MYADVVIFTTAQLCPCRGLYRPMLVTLSFSTKKNIKIFHLRKEPWDEKENAAARRVSWDSKLCVVAGLKRGSFLFLLCPFLA